MGFRFRRSIKVMPGVRLNFALAGISATMGAMGLSYRVPLSGSARQARGRGPTLRELERAERQAAREAERSRAEAEHASRELVVVRLRNILADRAREPLDWNIEFAPLGDFEPILFQIPGREPTADDAAADVRSTNPLAPWLWAALGSTVAMPLAADWWVRGLVAVPAMYFLARGVALYRARPHAAAALLQQRTEHYWRIAEAAQRRHEEEQAAARSAHEAEEQLRERMRGAVAHRDFEAVADFLEAELSNEDLPIPVEFEIHCEDLAQVSLTIVMPGREVVPDTQTSVTKTGRLSERRMGVRDRTDLYQDLCAGLLLRLVYETLRVLPFVERVDATGVVPSVLAEGGESPAARVSWSRERLAATPIDGADPSDLFRWLGGTMSFTRQGDLKMIEPGEQ